MADRCFRCGFEVRPDNYIMDGSEIQHDDLAVCVRLLKAELARYVRSDGDWWCRAHDRPATHWLIRGDRRERVCNPKLGGITMPCEAVYVEPGLAKRLNDGSKLPQVPRLDLKWAADKPTEPHRYYWFRPVDSNPSGRALMYICEATDDDGRKRLHANSSEDGFGWVDEIGGEWSGPLPEPK